jgi:hypothetical protein
MTMPRTRKDLALSLLLAAATGSSLAGCFADLGPTLPAPETLQVDISALAAAPAEARNADPAEGGPYVAFPTAWAHFTWLSELSVAVATVPISALQNARDVEPVLAGETWTWSVLGQGLDVLIGADGNTNAGFQTTMSVSASAFGLSSFQWLDGYFVGDATSGNWVLHDLNATGDDDEVLAVDWTFTSVEARVLTFENRVPDHDDEGDVLAFERNGTVAGARYTDASAEDAETLIVWDVATGAGYIESASVNAGARTCWDETFADRACEEVEALASILGEDDGE